VNEMEFSKKILSELEKRHKSINWLADEVKVSRQYMWQLLNDKRRWHEDLINKVCKTLNIKIAYKKLKRNEQ
jgi:DNA-binding phage protein